METEKAAKQLGDTIRAKRRALGFSQDSFADHCGLHRTYMGGIERGERNVSLVNIIKIAHALDLTASKLFIDAQL